MHQPSYGGWRAATVFVAAVCSSVAAPQVFAQQPSRPGVSLAAFASDDATGTAIVDVVVADRFGAPIDAATVRLSGVVNRQATTNDIGAASFTSLPAGRYDVVAAAGGLAASPPRVIDVKPFGLSSVVVTLKPFGPRLMGGSISCGGFDPASIKTLAATAHLVVHVKVLGQRTVEPGPNGARTAVPWTVNLVEVRQSFTRDPRAGAAAATLLVNQGGARIDRGDYVDFYWSNKLPPLNVGDEYGLFLTANAGGHLTILGAEEGAFRLRNGRVEPLGDGGAATTWKHRPVDEFFDALRWMRHAR